MQFNDDGTLKDDGASQAHPNPVRAREWYEWEQERNRKRRLARIGWGCAIVLLGAIAGFAAIGLGTVLGWL